MYWTDWGPTPKIERARLDGTERQTFISSGIQYPNGLALDESDKILYWAGTDANKYGIIEALSLDGLNRTVIFCRPGYHPFSLDIFEGFVYWSDWGKNAVLRINKTDGGGEEVIVGALNKPMGLKILHGRGDLPGRRLATSGPVFSKADLTLTILKSFFFSFFFFWLPMLITFQSVRMTE